MSKFFPARSRSEKVASHGKSAHESGYLEVITTLLIDKSSVPLDPYPKS